MTFGQLEYLLAVNETGSVTKAAKKLFVSHSSISISICNLEKELGYPLFTRTAKGLTPTDSGLKVIEHARNICRSYKLLNEVERETKRTVRINGNDNLLFARAFAQLVEETIDDDVRIIMQSVKTEEAYMQIVNDQLDLSLFMLMDFAYGYWEKRFKTANLRSEILRIIPASVRVGRGHLLYNRKTIFPYELKSERLLDTPQNPVSGSNLFRGTIYADPDKILYASPPSVQRELIQRGLAYSISSMPPLSFHNNDLIHYIPLKDVNYYMLAVTNTHAPSAPEISRFLQLLKQELDHEYPQ